MSKYPLRLAGASLVGVMLCVALFMSVNSLSRIRAKVDDARPLLVVDLMQWPQKHETPQQPIPRRKKVSPAKLNKSAAPPLEKTIMDKPLASERPKELPKPQIKEKSEHVLEPLPIAALPVAAKKSTDVSLPIPVPIFRLTLAPSFLHKEMPVYPALMRTQGNTGLVKLEVLIDEAGKVRRVKVVQSAGSEFDNAAKIAILASSFIPARVENKPVAVILRVPVNFELL